MKRKDINFVKFMKPRLKEQEHRDQIASRQMKYDKIGIPPPGPDVADLGLIASILRVLYKIQTEEKP